MTPEFVVLYKIFFLNIPLNDVQNIIRRAFRLGEQNAPPGAFTVGRRLLMNVFFHRPLFVVVVVVVVDAVN